MRKGFKKGVALLLASALIAGSSGIQGVATAADQVTGVSQDSMKSVENGKEDSTRQPFADLTGDEIIADMGAGWNLGNTMDGHTGLTPNETLWQSVKTTKKMIKEVHDLGYNTVRIPITWGNMIDDSNDYKINEMWLNRAQDIVDYCIEQDMYTIINIHHDGADAAGWILVGDEDQDAVKTKFAGVWKNIATAFKDYDEHLIFESMNEVYSNDINTYENNQRIMALNQIFVDTVRDTGSNNEQRWLLCPGRYTNIDATCDDVNGWSLPKDDTANHLMVSVHFYDPWQFCGEESVSDEINTKFNAMQMAQNQKTLKKCYDKFSSKGIPVVIGEYGCINKNNSTERQYWLEGMNRVFKKYKLTGVYWDQGWYDRSQDPDYSFTIVDRETGEPVDKSVTDAIMRGYLTESPSESCVDDTIKGVEIKNMTGITLSKNTVVLKMNESQTVTAEPVAADSNDVVLWKTSDPTIATVAYGKINGKGAGTATITAFSQSGSVKKEITVTVSNEVVTTPCTDIALESSSIEVVEEGYAWLNAVMTPADTQETLYYRSQDDSIASVSSVGKILGEKEGSTTIEVYSTGGMKKEVTVAVKKAQVAQTIRLALNAYYNDKVHNYFGNEISTDIITVTQAGQYQVTFDCERDFSDAAKTAGVTNLNNIGSLYIKDYDVSVGNTRKSSLESCMIRYDKIIINDQEVALNTTEFKTALKAKIFDTNNPINAWDGSVIDEVIVDSDFGVTFKGIEDPKTVTIVFSLDNFCFIDGELSTLPPVDTPSPPPEETPSVSPSATPSIAPTAAVSASPGGVTAAPTKSPSPNKSKLKKGTTYKKGALRYKVTNCSGKKYTVSVVKPVKKSIKSVVIPAKVTIKGTSLKVTAVQANAFENCKKLAKITFKNKKVPTIGKNSFKGIKKKAVFIVPAGTKNKYKKKFTAKIGWKKTMKIKVKK